jgi:spore coat polysaccharide biosynthesis protein SpsF
MEKIPFFIQARTNSSRLQKKMLLPFFNGRSILQILIERLLKYFPHNRIYLLTTSSGEDDYLVKTIAHYPIEIFRGDELNVLNRFLAAGNHFSAEDVIRICGDNPFLDINFLKSLAEADKINDDYFAYSILGRPAIKCHYGLFAERTKISVLKRIPEYTTDNYFYEHVTNFLYENPDIFKCRFLEVARDVNALKGIRLTVDTEKDFKNAQYIFEQFQDPGSFTIPEIAGIFRSSLELEESMQKEIQYNSK